MRASAMLSKTLREVTHDTEGGNQELLTRAGFMRQLTSGVYTFLPLGNRVIAKISQIVREEMNAVGGQEVTMPVLQPRDLWVKRPPNGGPTRAEGYGPVLFSLQDRRQRAMVLGPTHEEVVTQLALEFIRSYRDLPRLIYQIQIKERDEPRPRGGLLRSREFLMKDLYSFDADQQGLDSSYRKMAQAYTNVLNRCGLHFIAIEADSGAIGGKDSQEFIALTEAGEDEALVCENGDYAANVEKAEFLRSVAPHELEEPVSEIHTPGVDTIERLTTFLGIPASKVIKAVIYVASGKVVMAIVRGDLEINDVKLTNTLTRAGINAADLHLATHSELQKAGIVSGYASPLGLSEEVLIVADDAVRLGANFVAGSNKANYHLENVNYPRDFRVDVWDDVASAHEGAQCARCGGILHAVRGCEAGHIFKLGTKYSDLFGATYLDVDGESHPILMGTYGIGITRLMAIIVEQSHDDHGIIWPFSVAPYHVALVGLDLESDEIRQVADEVYDALTSAGVEVLYDDRQESAGVKFNDADLIGLPLRIVVSKRSISKGGAEIKPRSDRKSRVVLLDELVAAIQGEVQSGIAAAR